MYQRNLLPRLTGRSRDPWTRVNYGTNFRHAVEFSRSGRAPSQPSRATSGQPTKHYPVGSARSNPLETVPSTARFPLGRRRGRILRRVALGGRPRCPSLGRCPRGAVRRTRRTLVSGRTRESNPRCSTACQASSDSPGVRPRCPAVDSDEPRRRAACRPSAPCPTSSARARS